MVLGVVTVAAEAAFCYLGSERLPALSTICLFGCLACVWKFFCCLSFVISLNISLPFLQLLLFEQDTSVFYFNSHLSFEMDYNIPRLESKLLCLYSKYERRHLKSWRFYFALKRNETKQKLILHENIHATREQYPRQNWVQCLKIT